MDGELFLEVLQGVERMAGIGHLLIGLRFVRFLCFFLWKQPQSAHDPIQAFWTAGIPPPPQTAPQFDQAQVRVSAVHILNQLQFFFCMLVRVAVGPPRLTGQRFHCSIPACLPEVDVRPALVVFPAGAAHTVFLRVFH